MKGSGDSIAGASGGIIGAIITTITSSEMIEVVVFAFVGGFIGVFAKNTALVIWKIAEKKFNPKHKK